MDIIGAAIAKMLTTRWLVRAPILAYRAGVGWLLGPRMLMLQHRGRHTGEPRYVCLEVVDRPAPDRLVIVSGFGPKAQWYRNLLADPHCRISSGWRRDVPAVARLMTETESHQALVRYAHDHPAAWRRLRAGIDEAVGHAVDNPPVIELTLAGQE